jgi:hypothetical protein
MRTTACSGVCNNMQPQLIAEFKIKIQLLLILYKYCR